MKKLLLIIALLISALGLNAQSVIIDDLEFTVTSETPAECEVSGYSGEPTDVTIPSTVTISGKEFAVTSIGDRAFRYCSSLTSIELPSGVTSIGEDAFLLCESLTSIDFGENSQLTSIGESAFNDCSSLTSIEIPNGVTSIGDYAFCYCSSLTSIEIPSGVTSIGDGAFNVCSSLTSIEIPNSVTSIGYAAFRYCSSLTSIIVESGNTVYDSRDNCNAIIETATNTLIEGCKNTVIPNSVTSIGKGAFSNCSSLTSIDFGENSQLTSIGDYAFYYCSSLTSIEIPSGVTSIGDGAFYECSSLTSIDFGENSQLTSIGESAFRGCSSLTSIEIPSGVTSIGEWALGDCSSLTSIIVESGNTVYDSRDNCNAIIETATNTLIAGCQSTVIPNTVTSIGDWAFYYCYSLTSIEIPSGVTSIGAGAFWDCSSLTSIEIPSGVTSIGSSAFSYCYNLTSIYCHAENVPQTSSNAFNYCPSDMVIYVPEQSVDAYKAASPWNEYTIMVMPYFVTVATNPEDAGIITGAGAYAINDTVTLTATANEGYKFVNWTENDTVVSEVAEYIFVVENDREFVANFELLTYEVTASVNDENFGSVAGAGIYGYGEEVTLTATANEGYKFVNWTENDTVVSTEAEYSFVITGDRNLVANFELLTYEVVASVNIENAGEITGAGSYEENDTVTLTAKANEGYKFVNWTENDTVVSTEAEYSFVITRDRNLVANFELLTYEVVASVNIENAGEITGAGSYEENDTVTLTAKANEGYKFVNWTENDTVVSTEVEYSFVIIKDRNLVANFEKLEDPEEPADTTTLAAPTNLRAAIRQDIPGYNYKFEITMMWDAVDGAKGYDIYVNTADTIGFYMGYTNGTAYVAGTNNEGTLEFYVVAFNDSIESAPSETYTITIVDDAIEELEASYNIYPNPVNDKLYIETQTQTLTVEIYDVYGRRQSMVNGQQSMVNGQQSTVIDVTDLNSGVYFVKVVTSEGEAVKRFIKK